MQINEASPTYILTTDIGGTHITSAICNLELKMIIPESLIRVEVFSKDTADHIFAAWNMAFRHSVANSPGAVMGMGVAMPGPFDYENGISYIKGLDKYESIYGLNIKKQFAESLNLNSLNIRFRNDAESTIAGEIIAGAGQKYNDVVGITLGTGFGSAFSKNKITRDINWGSDKYKNSIADDYFSTRWFLTRYHELSESFIPGVKELAILAENDGNAIKVFNEFAVELNAFLKQKLPVFSPQALVICGNIAKANHLFLPYLKENLSPVIVELGQLGEHASLLGAASLFETPFNVVVNTSVN
ncbi:ROK family protein [Mucilaginibacter sp. X5P1]|uniref:ROK family protein n=1 Tax=Mucilaginibacter sp. X5P1 TaxID=2723088 RepID=UPI00160F7809|nr:ROK family protein [Mucilaginibacter sp. X5P1]MBB6141805.1 glucokinase [Mucilaginibacter sp. X5P1]